MSNIQIVSTKLQPINKTNNENAMASSNKREYFSHLMFGKENIGTGIKQSAANKVLFAKSKILLSPEKYRARKASDSIIYHSKQRQEIPVLSKIHHLINHWESKENVHPKRHLSENVGSSKNSKAFHDGDLFPKPEFKIYSSNEELKGKDASCSKHRSGIHRAEKLYLKKANIISVTTATKKIKLVKPAENKIEKAIKGSSHLKLKNPQLQNFLKTDTNTENIITPDEAFSAPQNIKNINKIKIHHKKSALDEKYRKPPNENLPPEVIYNLEYMQDFIAFQLELERSYKLSAKFLTKNVTPGQRRTVISFLIRVTVIQLPQKMSYRVENKVPFQPALIFVEVGASKKKFAKAYCSYPSFILYQTVKMFDRMVDSKNVETEQLQLVALTTLWITLKRLHPLSNIPTGKEILSFSKYGYQEKELYNCVMDIMITLKCEISYIEPFSILAYYFINIENPFIQGCRTDMMYYFGSYMIDISLLSSSLCNVPTTAIIAAAVEIALFMALAHENDLKHPDWQFWRRCLPKICANEQEIEVTMIEKTRKNLIKLALLSNNPSTDYIAVYKKYKRSRYGHISEIVIGRLLKVSKDDYNY